MLAGKLVSRRLQEASARLFAKLADYVRTQGYDCADAARWISGDDLDRLRASELRVPHKLEFSRHRVMAHLEIEGQHMIGLIGFDYGEVLDTNFIESDIGGPELFVLLSETAVAPNRSASEVLNVVGAASAEDEGYDGHASEDIQQLFPTAKLIDVGQGLDDETVWPAFLSICAAECARGNSWMDEGLAAALKSIAVANMERFPYQALCRSMFDMDPRSLFLAIYRCLEAIYAYDACTRLRLELGTELTWYELAEKLGDTISWYPKQAHALGAILRHVPDEQLEDVCRALNREVGDSAAASAGNAITWVRNRIVHFGPTTTSVEVDSYDWNEVCAALARVVTGVHAVAFREHDTQDSNPTVHEDGGG